MPFVPCSSEGRRLWSRIKYSAKKAGVPFSLTPHWFDDKLRGVCEQTGLPFERGKGTYHLWNFTVDRKVAALGYTPDNCQAVCWSYNAAKSEGTDADVLRMARALVFEKQNLIG